MGSPMRLSLAITADASGVAPATAEVRKAIDGLGTSARATAGALDLEAKAGMEAAAASKAATAAVTGQAAAQQTLRNNVVAFTGASTAAAAGTKLAAHEVTNLTRQISDIGVSLASGQSPFMVMIQQGAQVQDIMGRRGLGQVLTGLVAGIGSLATPTTAILLGITALGYGASAVFEAMQGDVEDVNLRVKDHLDLIDQVAKKWGGAIPGLKAYNDDLQRTKDIEEAVKALRIVAQEQYAGVAASVPNLQVDSADIISILSGSGVDSSAIAAFQREFAELQMKIAAGNATAQDAIDVQQTLSSDVLGVNIPAINDYAKAFADFAAEVGKATAKAQEFGYIQNGGMLTGRGGGTSRLSPLNPLDGFNRTPFQTEDEIRAERQRRAEQDAENKRLGALVPIPTRRPNLEDEPSKAQELLRSQDETIERLKVETLAIGQSEAARARMIAQLSAEQQIRRLGIDAQSEEAQAIRDGSAAITEATIALERSRDAWHGFQRAGESAIDKVLDKLTNGDFKGALEALASDLAKFLLEMAVANPLKNALFGTNYGTLGDLGDLGGGAGGSLAASIVGRLLGRPAAANDNAAPASAAAIAAPVSNVVRMPLAGIAANDNLADGDIAGYIRQAARLRGIDPDIALRVARSEGGVKNPFRQGEAMLSYGREESFGPFQLHMRQGGVGTRALAAGIDPRTNWRGGVDFALDEAANKGWGQWFGAAKAGIGNREGLEGARAIGQFSKALEKASGGLDGFDKGITGAIKAVSGGAGGAMDLKGLFSPGFKESGGGFASLIGYGSAAMAAPKAGAGGGGLLQLLFGLLPKLFGFRHGTEDAPPGWAWVGEDGPELMKFGGGEKVIAARRSAEITIGKGSFGGQSNGGTGYGGRDGGRPVNFSSVVNNYTSAKVESREEEDGRGGRRFVFTVSDQVVSSMNTPGSSLDREMRSRGATQPRRKR